MAEYTVQQLIRNHEKAFMPEAAEGVDAVIQYKLTGEQGGDWIITIHEGKCTVAEGIAPNPRMTMTADAQDFADVLTRQSQWHAVLHDGQAQALRRPQPCHEAHQLLQDVGQLTGNLKRLPETVG